MNTYSIDSSCAQQLRRPFGDKRTDHYGNKDTSPKKPTVRHVQVEFVEGWSIRLAQTFNCKPRQHWSRRYKLHDQHPQRLASASSQ